MYRSVLPATGWSTVWHPGLPQGRDLLQYGLRRERHLCSEGRAVPLVYLPANRCGPLTAPLGSGDARRDIAVNCIVSGRFRNPWGIDLEEGGLAAALLAR
jgi:hypothetical protein